MRIERTGATMRVLQVGELTEQGSRQLTAQVQAALAGCEAVEVDLSQTTVLNSWGLAALVGVYQAVRAQNHRAVVRLLSPLPPVQQLMDLTRMHRLFEIIPAPHG